jgi:hypothetical protein
MLRAAWQSRAGCHVSLRAANGIPVFFLPAAKAVLAHAALLACVALGRGLDLEGASTPHLTDDSGMDSEKVVVEVC